MCIFPTLRRPFEMKPTPRQPHTIGNLTIAVDPRSWLRDGFRSILVFNMNHRQPCHTVSRGIVPSKRVVMRVYFCLCFLWKTFVLYIRHACIFLLCLCFYWNMFVLIRRISFSFSQNFDFIWQCFKLYENWADLVFFLIKRTPGTNAKKVWSFCKLSVIFVSAWRLLHPVCLHIHRRRPHKAIVGSLKSPWGFKTAANYCKLLGF